MAATGSIVESPMRRVAELNAISIPEAITAYTLWQEMLQNNTYALILAALPLSLTAIGEGLTAYEATLTETNIAYKKVGLDAP